LNGKLLGSSELGLRFGDNSTSNLCFEVVEVDGAVVVLVRAEICVLDLEFEVGAQIERSWLAIIDHTRFDGPDAEFGVADLHNSEGEEDYD